MADHTFKLSEELSRRMAELAGDLQAEAQDHRDAFDDRSEKWQESEKGTVTDSWIESLYEVAEQLENVDVEPV
jgi:hypothetical protein